MAEFCLDCLNKYMGTEDDQKKFVITRNAQLCEGCGQYKRVVIRYKMRYMIADRWTEIVENVRNRQK